MAFTVEDGTQPAGANAYLTVADFKTHHTDRGVTAVAESEFLDTEIQSGIINATDYVDKRFGRRFLGWRRSRSQSLEWPRTDAYDDDDYSLPDIPDQLKKGIAEYALLALQLGRNLAPPPAPDFGIIDPATGEASSTASGQLSRSTEIVGPIEDTKEKRLVDANGRTATVQKMTNTPTDPNKPWRGASRVIADSVTGVFVFVDPAFTLGKTVLNVDNVKRGNQFVLFAAAGDGGKLLESFDEISDGSISWKIVRTELLNPGDTRLLYLFEVSR
jgi:hypothetical protein